MLSRIVTLCWCLTLLVPLVEADAQTRFVRPDTTPNYAAYRHADECIAAIDRLDALEDRANPVWSDTLELDTLRYLDSAPPHIVKVAQTCLATVNVDSIPYRSAYYYLRPLLLANRDADMERLYVRLKDSIRHDRLDHWFLGAYFEAKPSRIEKAESLLHRSLSSLPPDSADRIITLIWGAGVLAGSSGNRALASQKVQELITIFDTLSDKYKSQVKPLPSWIYKDLSNYFGPDALDSLTVSTDAYRNYLAHLWTAISGHPAGNNIGPIAKEAPQLTGQFWYSNRNGTIQKIAPTTAIEPGSVTIVYFVQGGCHSHYESVHKGRDNGARSTADCWEASYHIRRMMERYPSLKLVVVSKTFGSFADAPPLPPEQEADTLAQYFLGFRKLRGIHVISQTEFFRLPNYDNRIIDSRTENELAYDLDGTSLAQHNTVVLIDERGKIFYFGTGKISESADARLKAVMNRAANRPKE